MVSIIKSRYFFNGRIRHHGDCEIYSRDRCDCGLIHDLKPLDYTLAKALYEKYEDDLWLHDTGNKKAVLTESEQKESLRILEEIFGKITYTLKDVNEEYVYAKNGLECFTVEEYPAAFKRLEEWRKEQVENL